MQSKTEAAIKTKHELRNKSWNVWKPVILFVFACAASGGCLFCNKVKRQKQIELTAGYERYRKAKKLIIK